MTERMRVRMVVFASLFAGAAIIGCGQREPAVPTVLETRDQPYVSDVPVPKGFQIDRRQSDHSYKEGHRRIKHYYLGNKDPQSVRNFYYENMPTRDWRRVNETLSAGVYTLTFRKNEEVGEVRIEKVPAGVFSPSTQIQVTIRTPHLDRAE